ncbi:ctr copper transporter family protein-like protein [Bimuria novae-zelandiae CBS 107.79]|uniref:Copper transport protein n=1 Tax=Bimuria novae-zelandiae CBS 107.79 TaxID=1447943 RepID=A0A6A5US90_9PLEO|nr:ctr copper transporter family protein-like protein [Bimuria novae-zelandiae CBS 107.79]
MSHGGHSSTATVMGAGECQMEMLWNWRIVDSCILSGSWHIKNNAMFAASCVGAAMLVVALEFLRRLSSEWDAFLLRQFQRQLRIQQAALSNKAASCCQGPAIALGTHYATFRATSLQQLVRAIIHGITLGVAYLLMLIVMSFNGWIFISIVLGAILGKFLCDWMVVRIPFEAVDREEKDERRSSIAAAGPTGCCA